MRETATPTTPRQHFNMEKKISFYVASCVPDGGVYLCELDGDGNVETKKVISAPSPMWIEPAEDGALWVLMRAPFEDSPNSGVAKYDSVSGERISEILSTEGEVACHLAVDGDDLYAANYISGSVWSSKLGTVKHSGKGSNPVRQEAPHVHSTFFSPDKKYVLSCDLGLDKIFVYNREMGLISTADTPEGAGARHLVFSKDGSFVYCINEMSATVSVFSYKNGKLDHIHETDVKPQGYTDQGKGSAIRISADGKRIYVTERGSETISVLEADGDRLTLISTVSSHGAEPRDFVLINNEKMAVCTNQFGNNCSLYNVEENGTLSFVCCVPLSAPLCVVEF